MLTKLPKEHMGTSNLGWLKSRFHFSFAEYRNPKNVNFGALRVLNDDIIAPHSGFDTHAHANMEIITYVVEGAITHKDSMGNEEALKRGEVQYMSAGTGITHSEHNLSSDYLRSLQIWIYPNQKNLAPVYGSHKFDSHESKNQLSRIISSYHGDAVIKIHQDVNIYVSQLDKNRELSFDIHTNRQIYFVLIEGRCSVNGLSLDFGDAMQVVDENILNITALEDSHIMLMDMVKER